MFDCKKPQFSRLDTEFHQTMHQDSMCAAKQIEGLADYLSFEQLIREQLQDDKNN